jgi:hypothetical protein
MKAECKIKRQNIYRRRGSRPVPNVCHFPDPPGSHFHNDHEVPSRLVSLREIESAHGHMHTGG